MFKTLYRNLNEPIRPAAALEGLVLAAARSGTPKPAPLRGRLKRPAWVLAACAVLVLAAVPALAANVPAAYNLMYLISPAAAQFFKPVRMSCVDNGIRMEVVSAYIHGDTAQIKLTLQDLEGDRVDGTTDLFDSYSINRPFDSGAACFRDGYDPATRTASFLVQITEWGGDAHSIEGDKITFSLREFLSGKQTWDGLPVEQDLSALPGGLPLMEVDSFGGGGQIDFTGTARVLVPQPPRALAAPGIGLSGLGYADGKLHAQIAVKDRREKDTHGFLYLMDESGGEVQCLYNRYFTLDADAPDRTDYIEFVFDVPQEEIGGYRLYGTFFTSGRLTRGDWQVTFPLEAGGE